MHSQPASTAAAAWCLTHQLPEDQASPIGTVCQHCKQRLYVDRPQGSCRSFWESQPAAFALNGEPCFVYTLVWDDFRIRTLHPAGTEFDIRSQNVVHESALVDQLEREDCPDESPENWSPED